MAYTFTGDPFNPSPELQRKLANLIAGKGDEADKEVLAAWAEAYRRASGVTGEGGTSETPEG
jgi:hypothetical protein